jgi:hypothetical protein
MLGPRPHRPVASRRLAAVTSVACLCAALIAAPCALRAQAFIRGDANADGRVSGSDAQYILSHAFQGGEPPQCLRTAEIIGDGQVDIHPVIWLLNYLLLGGLPPCRPFPEPGEDPESELSCDRYEPTPPAEDPRYVLEVSDAIASAEGTTTITLLATNPEPIAGYFGALRLAGGRFCRVDGITDVSRTLSSGFMAARPFDGELHFGFLSSFINPIVIEPGERRPVLQIDCCLETGLDAGDHGVTFEWAELTSPLGHAVLPDFVPGTLAVLANLENIGCTSPPEHDTRPRCGPPEVPPDLVCSPDPALSFLRGDVNLDGRLSIADVLRTGDLFLGGPAPSCCDAADANDDGAIDSADIESVLEHLYESGAPPPPPFPASALDPTPDGLGCAADPIVPAAMTVDAVSLGDASGSQYDTVRIPVVVSSTAEIDGFQLVFRVHPDIPEILRPAGLAFEDSFYERYSTRAPGFATVRAVPGTTNTFVAALIPELTRERLALPPQVGQTAFYVRMQLWGPVGFFREITVELTDGEGGAGFGPLGLRNELGSAGRARFPQLGRAGIIHVVGGLSILRGDSNHDGRVDVSDGVHTLNWLFFDGPQPACLDDADVDDSGSIDLSDPIALFNYLFLGGPPPRPPFPGPGLDPTPDALAECFE